MPKPHATHARRPVSVPAVTPMPDTDDHDPRLVPVRSERDILPHLRDTPVGDLLRYHNLGADMPDYAAPELLVAMCMDHRNALRLPSNFAYILRAGGANFRRHEFKVSFAIAVGGVRAMALIGHSQCGMVHLMDRRQAFIEGLVSRAGWTAADAAEHFDQHAPRFALDDAADFVRTEAARLRTRYPGLTVLAPLYYKVEDNLLWQIRED